MSRTLFVPLLMMATCSQNETPATDAATPAAAAAVMVENPTKIGECAERTIASISTRFNEKLPSRPPRPGKDGGSFVQYTSKHTQVSYDWSAVLAHSKIGDRVRMCLVSIPKDCPPGDDRGRVYETTNLRTNESWTMPDDPHMCGGA
ncbi:hypothetical protein BRADO4431 [Bradyrhizobium sp. ORS 278]|uniref:hypothetical protein n=1 Tax=Bradyrhizobium sp. (strain ORS 278) TaxID=114615 RepID=UPI0001508477|nr:hypothetical protein [Bradyrhizobium sp. ORS 278]CAL78174.1 hypothetical protein BRADO4431 [Bradyrhizobium sp. ORS 278]